MAQTLTLSGTNLSSYGVFISSDTFLNSPEITYEAYDVPNVDGSLLKSENRLSNVVRTFECYCKNSTASNLNALKNYIYSNRGYIRIESSYDPGFYQMGYLAEAIEFEPFDYSGDFVAKFSLVFSCKPQKFFVETQIFTCPLSTQSMDTFIGVYSRNSTVIQQLFKDMPVSLQDNSTVFAVHIIAEANSRGDTFTNMTASVSGTSDNWICLAGMNTTVSTTGSKIKLTYIAASFDATVSASSYTSTATSGETTLVAVIPIDTQIRGNVTGSARVNGSTKTLSGITTARNAHTGTVTNADAVGETMTLELNYAMEDATSNQISGTHCIGFYDTHDVFLGSCIFILHFEQMPSDVRSTLFSYMNPSGYFTVKIDQNYNATATAGQGLTTLITEYYEVIGEKDEMCKRIRLFDAYLPPSSGTAYSESVMKIQWWTV